MAILAAAACGDNGTSGEGAAPVTVRLGFFPNVTHATAIVGVERGIFAEKLGRNRLETRTFNAGPEATEALLSGAVDATYIGPNPAINAFAKSKGAIRIISGATSGGAFLVVRAGIGGAADLKGTKLATPQLGGTQDVALRWWLKTQGLSADRQGGGDVSVQPQENAQTLESFKAGQIDGAWVPEPWATRLVVEGDGKVLVDEADLWPGGRYVTTQLAVRTEFLEQNPGAVERLLEGQVAANALLSSDPEGSRKAVVEGIKKVTGKALDAGIVAEAWDNLEFTNDPVASSLLTSAEHAKAIGFPTTTELDGIYDLAPLNKVLKAAGAAEVKGL